MTANETFDRLLLVFIGAVQNQRDNATEPLSQRTAEADYAKVETARKDLRAHVARLEEDARRLDWLEERVRTHFSDLVMCWDHEDGIWLAHVRKGDIHGGEILNNPKATALRQAIDAAHLSSSEETNNNSPPSPTSK